MGFGSGPGCSESPAVLLLLHVMQQLLPWHHCRGQQARGRGDSLDNELGTAGQKPIQGEQVDQGSLCTPGVLGAGMEWLHGCCVGGGEVSVPFLSQTDHLCKALLQFLHTYITLIKNGMILPVVGSAIASVPDTLHYFFNIR